LKKRQYISQITSNIELIVRQLGKLNRIICLSNELVCLVFAGCVNDFSIRFWLLFIRKMKYIHLVFEFLFVEGLVLLMHSTIRWVSTVLFSLFNHFLPTCNVISPETTLFLICLMSSMKSLISSAASCEIVFSVFLVKFISL
jgi:hypothetical protein